MKIALGIPTSGAPSQPFLESLTQLHIPTSVSSFERIVVSGNYVPAQRELIVRRALDAGAERLLMCDDDMILPPDALQKLAVVLDRDPECALAGALYYSRDGFRPMAVDDWDPENTTTAHVPAFTDQPVTVSGVGFGCVLVRLDALAAMEVPYFTSHVYIEADAARVRVCDEDYLMCARLRAMGHRIVLHAGLRCGHYDRHSGTTQPLVWEDASTTAVPRMAVLADGCTQLVPLAQAQAGRERHERVQITYVWPQP